MFSLVPEALDHAAGEFPPEAAAYLRFHEPTSATGADLPVWGDPDLPLVYVTFGSVTGSLGHFDSVFRDALDGLAGLDARVLMTVGRRIDPDDLAPWPANARVEQWLPQGDVLANAAAMIGHGGFGTTMGALVAGVPQVVVPIFTFDQVVNGAHVAAVGAGIAVPIGPGSVAARVRRGTRPARRTVVRRAGARRRRRVRRAAAPLEMPCPSSSDS